MTFLLASMHNSFLCELGAFTFWLDQEATKSDGCASLFFAIQNIIDDTITCINQKKSLCLESWRKSKVPGLMRSRGGGRKFEVILPQPLTDVKVCLSFLCVIFALIGSESCSSCWSSSQILFLLCISMHTLCTTYQCLFVRESTHVYYVCLCACMYACLCVSLYAAVSS